MRVWKLTLSIPIGLSVYNFVLSDLSLQSTSTEESLLLLETLQGVGVGGDPTEQYPVLEQCAEELDHRVVKVRCPGEEVVVSRKIETFSYSYKYPSDCLILRRLSSGFKEDNRRTHISRRTKFRKINGIRTKVILTDQPNAVIDYIPNNLDLDDLSSPHGDGHVGFSGPTVNECDYRGGRESK